MTSKITDNTLIGWLQKETTRYFSKIKVHVVSFVLSLLFKNVFGMYLAPLVCLKAVKYEMPGNFQVRSQGIL
jgi:hypothetical protein